MAQFNDDTAPTLEFESGELVKVNGARPNYMDGHSLIRLVKFLAKLNLKYEAEIGRYKAEVDEHEAEADRLHQRNLDADVFQRRDLFATAALMRHAELITVGSDPAHRRAQQLVIARLCYSQADAMEAARTEQAAA